MDKKMVFIVIVLITIAVALHAEAPELRKVMPNSWRKVSKLTAEEETVFLRDNSGALSKIKTVFEEMIYWWTSVKIVPNPDYLFIYKQTVGDDIFFRVLLTDEREPDFLSKDARFIQCLIYNGRFILGGEYNAVRRRDRGSDRKLYSSLDIIEGKSGAKGVMLTQVSIGVSLREHGDREIIGDYKIDAGTYFKGQLAGGGGGRYFLMSDIRDAKESEFDYSSDEYYGFGRDADWSPDKEYYIKISASPCLIDADMPLRYSLQNAFDNDPSTSFVENSKDDLLTIKFSLNGRKVQRFAVINGYAQNLALYKANNRIKTIALYTVNWSRKHKNANGSESYGLDREEKILLDNTLNYQFINTDTYEFEVEGIYKGSKYNDTCLAELNVLTEEDGWLFGEIDE